ncbi:hypothetical protein J1N35_031151 [Gossypium stocksii]|uniref:Cellulose synthase n=1 Tax=Gossypium stocksii TaxID=47602 RepID=A0A9D3V228_9ROSI|nr:hypothetical protein J1N35_031151 [Gossypium stocksii]
MESGVPVCHTCGEHVGLNGNGEPFVACHDCNFPICKTCFDYELKEGRKACLRCGNPYDENLLDDAEKASGDRSTMAAHMDKSQDAGTHARHISSVSTLDSEMTEDNGNPIWKNRVESWKEKKNKKKKTSIEVEIEAKVPPGQLMEDKPAADTFQSLSTVVPIPKSRLAPYRTVIIMRFIILGLFFHYRVTNPVNSAFALWLTSVICEIWFAFSWVLDQFPKWYPINRDTYIDRLSARYEREGKPSELAAVDFCVSTVDPLKEPPLITANTVLSILALDYPVDKVSCYVSDDGAAMLSFESLVETADFARKWVPFCKKFSIEPRAPEFYFSQKIDCLKDKVQPSFVKERRAMKRDYEEYKIRINALVAKAQKTPEEGWTMQDGTPWPGNNTRDHPGMIQVFLGYSGARDIDGNELPRLVYVSREKRPGYQHHKKAGAENALVRVSAVLTNAPFILNLDCDHYVNNSKAVREAMCFLMDPEVGRDRSFEKTFGLSSVFIESTIMENGGVAESANPSTLIKEAIHVISCGYEEKTEWGKEIGWIYGSVTEDILTGFKMHCRGWRSIYCMPLRPAFKGSAPINLSDRLHQVLRWALGSVEIFLSRHCPLWYGFRGGRLKWLQRMAYINTIVYPFTSLPLIAYCTSPAICLLTGKFIIPTVTIYSIVFYLMPMLAGIDTNFTVTAKAAEDAEFGELYIVKWTTLFIPPTTLLIINMVGVVAGFSDALNRGYEAWGPLFGKVFFSFWVILHLYPFLKGLMGRQNRTPTIVVLWSVLLASVFSRLGPNQPIH